MKTINESNIKQVNNKEKNMSTQEERNEVETQYLSSIPGFVKNVNDIREKEDWSSCKEYNPNEKW